MTISFFFLLFSENTKVIFLILCKISFGKNNSKNNNYYYSHIVILIIFFLPHAAIGDYLGSVENM